MFDLAMLQDAVRLLEKANVPPSKDGHYVAMMSPRQAAFVRGLWVLGAWERNVASRWEKRESELRSSRA